ncbi:endo-1,4-beta-xylanase [Lyngbya aestuarii]|uniref:endo-1,4-beta-xylanase n=1 Tax=Lyngbya aestuarii TaxID=118322 RepID=UPI00403E226E
MPKNRLITRRHALHLGLGTLATMGALANSCSLNRQLPVKALDDSEKSERDLMVVRDAPLKDHAAAKGLIYGAAALTYYLKQDEEFAASIAQECGMLVPGLELKWKALRPSPDSFKFGAADWLAEFAQTHGMLFRGHTLVWHQATPKWFKEVLNRQNAEKILLEHIAKVAGHYAGKMHSWDVVNEAIEPDHERSDGLRNSRWLRLLGPDYIDLAFRATAEADPKAMLVYNDYGLDNDTPKDEARRVATLKLLERLKSKGTPVHALGTQAHLWAKDSTALNFKKLKTFLRDVADMGLKILVTELDVKDNHLPQDIQTRDRDVAKAYEDYISAVLEEPAVIAVLTWGLSDRYTWRSHFPRKDKAAVRPLPLDKQMKRKLTWNAMTRAFDQAPVR